MPWKDGFVHTIALCVSGLQGGKGWLYISTVGIQNEEFTHESGVEEVKTKQDLKIRVLDLAGQVMAFLFCPRALLACRAEFLGALCRWSSSYRTSCFCDKATACTSSLLACSRIMLWRESMSRSARTGYHSSSLCSTTRGEDCSVLLTNRC